MDYAAGAGGGVLDAPAGCIALSPPRRGLRVKGSMSGRRTLGKGPSTGGTRTLSYVSGPRGALGVGPWGQGRA